MRYPLVKTASLYGQLLQNRKLSHLWRHNLGSRWKLQKMARENFSIGALYNITKNQDNPIKTVGRDSFLSPKTPKNTSFLAVTQPPGSHCPYILGDTTRPSHITYILVWSKSDQRRLRKTLHKQTDKPTDTTKIMVTWPWTKTAGVYVQVRNSSGDEGYIPTLSCVIPTPDDNALTAVERSSASFA